MLFVRVFLQEASFLLATWPIFRFANGLGRIFKHLDDMLRTGILGLIGRNHSFDVNFGKKIGQEFPSLHRKPQNEILKAMGMDGASLFATGFTIGLESSFRYLHKDLQAEILAKLPKENWPPEEKP